MASVGGPDIVTEDLIFAVDAASTRSYSGSGTNWVDLSGQGNNATLGSNVTYNAGGWMDFNGTQNTNSNVAVPISRGELGDNMSIEAFFRYDGAGNASYRPIVGGNDPGAGTEVFFGKNSGNTSFGVQDGNYNGAFVTNYNVFDGAFHHFVYTYASGSGKIYLDGVLRNTASFTKANAAEQVYIGAEVQEGYFWDGAIPLVRYYTQVLTATEVAQNYNAQKSRFGL